MSAFFIINNNKNEYVKMSGEFLLDLYTIKFVIGWELCSDQIIVASSENYIIDSGINYNDITNRYIDELLKHHYKLKEANEELMLDRATNTICIAGCKDIIDESMENSSGGTFFQDGSDPCSSKDTANYDERAFQNGVDQRPHCVPSMTSPYFNDQNYHFDRYHRQEHYIRQEPGILTSRYQPHFEESKPHNRDSGNLVKLMDDMVLI